MPTYRSHARHHRGTVHHLCHLHLIRTWRDEQNQLRELETTLISAARRTHVWG